MALDSWPARYVALGQLCFAAMMTSCWLIRPSATAMRDGLSYYGTHVETAGLFVAGVFGAVILTALALVRLRSGAPWVQRFRRRVGFILVLTAAVPLTPYSLDAFTDWLHIGITTTLFTLCYGVGAWIAVAVVGGLVSHILLIAQSIGALFALLAQVHLTGWMIPSQVLFQLAFAALIVLALAVAVTSPPSEIGR